MSPFQAYFLAAVFSLLALCPVRADTDDPYRLKAKLPPCSQAEITAVNGDIHKKILTYSETQKLSSLWRGLEQTGPSNAGSNFGEYEIRFYQKKKLLCFARISETMIFLMTDDTNPIRHTSVIGVTPVAWQSLKELLESDLKAH